MDEQPTLRALLRVRLGHDLAVDGNYCADRHLTSRHALCRNRESPGHALFVLHLGILHLRSSGASGRDLAVDLSRRTGIRRSWPGAA